MSLSRNVTGREFQRHGPATVKLLSPRRVRVLLVAHVKTSADRSDRQPMSVKSWQSSARYCGSWPCNAWMAWRPSVSSLCRHPPLLLVPPLRRRVAAVCQRRRRVQQSGVDNTGWGRLCPVPEKNDFWKWRVLAHFERSGVEITLL